MAQHIVIIGAVALGPKAACRFKRLEPGSRVTMIDRMRLISYGGCGIPYFVSGDVSSPEELQSTSYHAIRDANFFKTTKDVDVMTGTEAVGIDRAAKTVTVRDVATGKESVLSYDKLVIGTGCSARRIPIQGYDTPGVFAVSSLDEAIAIKAMVARGDVGSAVIVGGGFIGLEMAEAFADMWGIETTVVEVQPQILPGVAGRNLARMAQKVMEEGGVTFHLAETVQRIEGDGKVERVVTNKRTIEADMVVMAVGVVPNDQLAKAAGLNVHERGGIVVDATMRTSDPDIFAGGDCVVIKHQVTGQPFFLPMGSMANRQGRVIGTNLAGGAATFDGAVGSWCVKLFEQAAAGTGLTLSAALAAGFDAVSVHVSQFDRAHFYPTRDLMSLEMVLERGSRRVLGVQGISGNGDALVGRIDAVAAILPHRPTVDDISNLELAYSPPFASAMDILNALANAADNTLAGRMKTIDVDAFAELFANRDAGDVVFLDCRASGNSDEFAAKYPDVWKPIPQDELRRRMNEVPRDKQLVLVCNTGVRSFEAQIVLTDAGVPNTLNLQGGMTAVRKWGMDI
ncbi:MAG: FAD-dependent oxidoreductase [Desulfovibrionaceae bacterium]